MRERNIPSENESENLAATQRFSIDPEGDTTKMSVPRDKRTQKIEKIVASIPGYSLIRELGKGGFGIVYLAEDLRNGQAVAIKVLKPQVLKTDLMIARFQREVQMACRLRHPNIVSVQMAGEIQGVHYLVMEYVAGQNLKELMRTSVLDQRSLIGLIREATAGLDYAHEHGVVHRDLKPSNIMLEASTQRVVIMDFGLAKPEDPGHTLTSSNMVVGTPIYMSPEQVLGTKGKVDRRTDLYSMGVILYEIVTGRLPFMGKSAFDVLKKIMEEEPLLPSRIVCTVDPGLEEIIVRAIAKERSARYQKAGELIRDLDAYLSGDFVDVSRRTQTISVLETQCVKVPRHSRREVPASSKSHKRT